MSADDRSGVHAQRRRELELAFQHVVRPIGHQPGRAARNLSSQLRHPTPDGALPNCRGHQAVQRRDEQPSSFRSQRYRATFTRQWKTVSTTDHAKFWAGVHSPTSSTPLWQHRTVIVATIARIHRAGPGDHPKNRVRQASPRLLGLTARLTGQLLQLFSPADAAIAGYRHKEDHHGAASCPALLSSW